MGHGLYYLVIVRGLGTRDLFTTGYRNTLYRNGRGKIYHDSRFTILPSFSSFHGRFGSQEEDMALFPAQIFKRHQLDEDRRSWESDEHRGSSYDQVHRVNLGIPPAAVFETGQISLEFEP